MEQRGGSNVPWLQIAMMPGNTGSLFRRRTLHLRTGEHIWLSLWLKLNLWTEIRSIVLFPSSSGHPDRLPQEIFGF